MTYAAQHHRLIICADDYGISPAVSLGIRQLAAAGRLTATGAMTGMPACRTEAASLLTIRPAIAIGLHITLTDQRPLTAMPIFAPQGRCPAIGPLLKASFSGPLPKDEIAAEIEAQLDAFFEIFGRAPDFIDGHQHVHLLPGLRTAVLALFHRRLDPATCWLRDCRDIPLALLRRGSGAKAGVISALALGLRSAARRRGIPTNRGFSGFYDPKRETLAERLPAMLTGLQNGGLLMVHPGHVDDALRAVDSLTDCRENEWSFLMSEVFPALLAQRGFAIAAPADVFKLTP